MTEKHPFGDIEDDLAAYYLMLYKQASNRALGSADALNKQVVDTNDGTELTLWLLLLGSEHLDKTYNSTDNRSNVLDKIDQAHQSGANRFGPLAFNALKQQQNYTTIQSYGDSFSDYYVNKYYDRFVRPRLQKVGNEAIAKNVPFDEVKDIVKSGLAEQEDKSQNYWSVISNVLISMQFHWAAMKAGTLTLDPSSVGQYTYTAVLDDRTTTLCKSLDGRRYSIGQVLNATELALTSPASTLKGIKPFLDPTASFDSQSVLGSVPVPPLHWSCRSLLLPSI